MSGYGESDLVESELPVNRNSSQHTVSPPGAWWGNCYIDYVQARRQEDFSLYLDIPRMGGAACYIPFSLSKGKTCDGFSVAALLVMP